MYRAWIVLFWLVLSSCLCSAALLARTGKNRQRSKTKEVVGPQEHAGAEDPRGPEAGGASENDFLADFAGRKRLWVITAPSYNDNYLRMMEKQIQESEALNCRLAERDTLIVTIIQNAMMEGKIQHTSMDGKATEQALDSDMVTKLLHYLELEHQTFSMLILKKNLKIGERFPYPVRVEAVLEVIDNLPARKLERVARKGSVQRCKITKKRLVVKHDGGRRRRIFSFLKQGNLTSIVPSQRQGPDKAAAIRSKVKDILNGRFRFVIRKTPAVDKLTLTSKTGANEKVKLKQDSPAGSTEDAEEKTATKMEHKSDDKEKDRTSLIPEITAKQKSDPVKPKGKGKKDKHKKKKKGKKGGSKSQQEVDSKETTALKEFMEKLKDQRRLLVISSPSEISSQYIQQRDDNELHSCDLALRKITVLSILGSEKNPTLRLQHYRRDGDLGLALLPDNIKNPELINQIRKEYGLHSKEFSMRVTDYDLRPNLGKVFSLPTTPSAIIKYIDTFQSRRTEKAEEKNALSVCSPSEANTQAEDSLLRFMSKRRLLIISAPTEDDYSFHQQIQALNGQECHMGIRHFALLKLVGKEAEASGTVELFPLNGKSQTEKELLSPQVVRNLRDQLKITTDYFNMLVVGKDGEVKAWFPTAMWSLSNIYDLVDSMELRQQELKLQQTLGIHCPEESGGTGEGTYRGYTRETEDSYLYHQSED
ncbi:Coiled-coil domain-containing protein 80 [Bagarius yarrelli]|uniref:Coiled-coil domain-containing protein 80 n=1 Tax=Bagarius yarrelli TaxID=175774 RepID=A0A556V6R3_BAGYA|nr:Coiled-coil domain-containing protein 80 [Bagarius yarrelli]